MIKNARLSPQEAEQLRQLAIKINTKRLRAQRDLLPDSKVLHLLLQRALASARVTEDGEVMF